jgi:hypothetical protein
MKRELTIILAAVFFVACFSPFIAAEMTAKEQAEKYYYDVCSFAEEDAQYEFGDHYTPYLAMGCLLGPVGVFLGSFIFPSVPPSRIIGRPYAYVAQYTKCYIEYLKWNNLFLTVPGCILWGGAVAVYVVIIRYMPGIY